MSGLQEATVGAEDGPTVAATNRSHVPDIDIEHWARVAVETLVAEHVTGGHLDLTFIDPVEMAELNHTYMGQDGPTDVLSFPLDGDAGPGVDRAPVSPDLGGAGGGSTGSPPVLLGDVLICPQVATEQAPEHGGDPGTEFTLLVVHGVLHILGHDHAEPREEAVMVDREVVHLRRHGLTHPGPVRAEPDHR